MSAKTKILIIEDDASIAAGLRMNLRHEGYDTELAQDGEAGVRIALEQNPALILLDIMIPGMNGYEVLRELRRRGFMAGVIMLTAKDQEEDKVLGLELGADDYVQKPFGLPELLARIRAVLRRRDIGRPAEIRFGQVVVNRESREVSVGKEMVALSPREMSLLLFLVEHEGRALSRAQILEGVWGFDYDGTTRTVDNFIVSLRKKLGSESAKDGHFQTVRAVGYRFRSQP